jgi:ATP-dependent Clp endopeptidase proteolytic subunit ClpP
MKAWGFTLRGEGSETLEIDVYDVIGESWWNEGAVSAKKIRKILKENKNASLIKLRVNSGGGDVIDGFAIYNLLSEHPARVEADVDALAASMASVIIMAADEVRIASNAMLMIHNPWGGVMGEANDFRRYADLLDKLRDNIADIYVAKTGIGREEILALMDAETWLDASEAKEKGFVDTVRKTKAKLAASALKSIDFSDFQNVPAHLQPEPKPDPKAAAQSALPFIAAEQQNQKETSMSKATFAALGVEDEDAAIKMIAKLNKDAASASASATLVQRFEALAGASGDEALGAFKAWKEDAAAKAVAEQKLADLQAAADKTELALALDKAEADKKISPADRTALLAQVDAKEFTVKGAVAYLGNKSPNAILANEIGSNQVPVVVGGEGGAKGYEFMSNYERVALQNADPDLFKSVRADWEKRGMPEAPEQAAE